MRKSIIFFSCVLLNVNLIAQPWRPKMTPLSQEQAQQLINLIPETNYQSVIPLNVIADKTYLELVKEGWKSYEIIRLTDDYYSAHKAALKADKNGDYIAYTKKWRPYNVSAEITNEPVTAESSKMQRVANASLVDVNTYFSRVYYSPTDRKAGIRNPGYFRHNAIFPSAGRTTWIEINPTDDNKLMVVADGDGIWKTDDMGKHWDCITDRIPNRSNRSKSDSYSIPVDPDNWNHVYAFTANSTVYKTTDGGSTWTLVNGATHKDFKRGYCFRDAAGNLKFIGATPVSGSTPSKLWLSSDTCKTWESVVLAADQYDVTVNGVGSFRFQEIAFHPTDRNIIYASGTRGILKSTDGGSTWSRMTFNVYGSTLAGTVRVENATTFPLSGADCPMFINVNPNNANEMWVALAVRTPYSTALYKSVDGGANWITLHEPSASIGSGLLYGTVESAWNWLGAFGVNFSDPRYVYGSSMSNGESSNYGVDFSDPEAWSTRQKGFYPDGNIYTVSASHHSADNHYIKSTKSGRIYKGSDGGLMVKDPLINGYKWTNIHGDMGNMLSYACATNEFGDYAVSDNSQDIDIHTYRGGRWGKNRGYEGDDIWMNPYSNEEYFSAVPPAATTTRIINQNYTSWNKGWTKADVCTGNWYVRREVTNTDGSRFSIIKDFGKTSIGLDNSTTGFVQDFALSRDVVGGKLFIVRGSKLYFSTDNGTTYTQINIGSITSPSKVAVNPNNSNEIYLAKTGSVYKTLDGGTTWQTISTAVLSGASVTSFYYHEGSGDLYYVSATKGIFIKEASSSDWRLWMDGYNKETLKNAIINYTSQEMIIADYGRGIWVADLQHPADRYLSNAFLLKQLSNVNNARTFGIDVHYTIPMYYYYKWYVNGVLQTNENGQYFTTSTLVPGDKVKLEVTLRESPDITTQSAEYVVVDEPTTTVINARGNYLYSNRMGRVDLGYVDHFFGNFSLQMWVNPKSDGVILANRQLNTGTVKGFCVGVESGRFVFKYAPENNFEQPLNETAQTFNYSLDGGVADLNTWSQITITHNRSGNISFYVNGVLKATQIRALPSFTLNNSLYLSLFADGYEYNAIEASVDEFKIWNEVLTQEDVRKSIYATIQPTNAKLIYYNDFNAASLDTQKERFSQKGMSPRVNAQVTIAESVLGVCANATDYKTLSTSWTSFMKQGVVGFDMRSNDAAFLPAVTGLFYDENIFGSATNLLPEYFTIYPHAFGVKMYEVSDLSKLVDFKVFLDPVQASTFQDASFYVCDLNANTENWTLLGKPTYNDADKSLSLLGVTASNINNKRVCIVKNKPAIEYSSLDVNSNKELTVYTPELTATSFRATMVGGELAPSTDYHVVVDNPVVKSATPLSFVNDIATNQMSIQLDDNAVYNSRQTINVVGEDSKMIPYTFSVVDKITDRLNYSGVKLNTNGAIIGTATTYANLNGKKTATFMGWIRIENVAMLTGNYLVMSMAGSGGNNNIGIILKNGQLCARWNDSYLDTGINSGLTIKSSQVGQWLHVALTVSATEQVLYLNGVKGTPLVRNVNGALITAGLALNVSKNFNGCIDQVSVWNRTLTQQEILKYMHTRVYLNESGLVSYIPFDQEVASGGYADIKLETNVTPTVAALVKQDAYFPFNQVSQQIRTKGTDDGVMRDGISFTLPSSYSSSSIYCTSKFKGLPYNYIDVNYPDQEVLVDTFRTIHFGEKNQFTTERIQFSLQQAAIMEADSVIFYARPLGSEASFSIRYATLATGGNAQFDVPASIFNENLTYMFYRKPSSLSTGVSTSSSTEPYRYKLTVDNGYCVFHNLRGNAEISFYSLNGQLLKRIHTNENKYSEEMEKGAYLIKIEEMGVRAMVKIIM